MGGQKCVHIQPSIHIHDSQLVPRPILLAIHSLCRLRSHILISDHLPRSAAARPKTASWARRGSYPGANKQICGHCSILLYSVLTYPSSHRVAICKTICWPNNPLAILHFATDRIAGPFLAICDFVCRCHQHSSRRFLHSGYP